MAVLAWLRRRFASRRELRAPDGYLTLAWLDHGINEQDRPSYARACAAARGRLERSLRNKLTSHESSYYGSPLWRGAATSEYHSVLIHPNADERDEDIFYEQFPRSALLITVAWYGDDRHLRARLSSLGEVVFDLDP